MKKRVVFLCVISLMLAGCQMRLTTPNTEINSGQITPSDSWNEEESSGDNSSDVPTQFPSNIGDGSSNEGNSSDYATLNEECELKELKNEGSFRGEIEVTHKLPCGKMNLAEGNTVLFRVDTKLDDAELKIIFTGTETGTTLECSVTGSGDISFEIDTADEYTVVLENCSLCGVQFTINYSIGGSK